MPQQPASLGLIRLRHWHGEEARCAEPEIPPAQALQPVMTQQDKSDLVAME
jgi:hypothetical protein